VERTICAPACKGTAYSLFADGASQARCRVGTTRACARLPICEIDRALTEGCMNLRQNLVLIALRALVAAAAALVYAQNEVATGEAAAREQTAKVLYDFNALPDPVKRMLQQIACAAESGEIETMRPVFESNELKPMVATEYVDDPVAFWKKASADGTGRDVLAAMLNVAASGYVRVGQG